MTNLVIFLTLNWKLDPWAQLIGVEGYTGRGAVTTPVLPVLQSSSFFVLRIGSLFASFFLPGKQIQVLSGHLQWVYCCSISPDCSMLCSAAGEKSVSLQHYCFNSLRHGGLKWWPGVCECSQNRPQIHPNRRHAGGLWLPPAKLPCDLHFNMNPKTGGIWKQVAPVIRGLFPFTKWENDCFLNFFSSWSLRF